MRTNLSTFPSKLEFVFVLQVWVFIGARNCGSKDYITTENKQGQRWELHILQSFFFFFFNNYLSLFDIVAACEI